MKRTLYHSRWFKDHVIPVLTYISGLSYSPCPLNIGEDIGEIGGKILQEIQNSTFKECLRSVSLDRIKPWANSAQLNFFLPIYLI